MNLTETANNLIVIPLKNIQKEISEHHHLHVKQKKYSKQLIALSKYLVEALIESNLTETQLIQAQQALESDDNTLDQQILSRLKTDGFNGEGEPLFPDLDQLYDLQQQAEEALSS